MNFFTHLNYNFISISRKAIDLVNPLGFYLISILIFVFFFGLENNNLVLFLPAIIWVSAFLANLLALDKLYSNDYYSGVLELFLIDKSVGLSYVSAKLVYYYIITVIPQVLVSFFVGLVFNLSYKLAFILALSLLLGNLLFTILGAIVMAVLVNIKKSNILTSVILLPLFIPVIIFASSILYAASHDLNYIGSIGILLSLVFILAPIAPFAIYYALKLGYEV
tara:strand:- start:4810 stop:5475 length:666 start_codon:yes stop_codon:yes gene_type:complete